MRGGRGPLPPPFAAGPPLTSLAAAEKALCGRRQARPRRGRGEGEGGARVWPRPIRLSGWGRGRLLCGRLRVRGPRDETALRWVGDVGSQSISSWMRPARIAESSPRLFTAQPEPHVESRVPVLCPPRRAVPSHPRTSLDAAPRRSVGPCPNAAVWEPCWESQGTTTRKNHRAPISFFRLKQRGVKQRLGWKLVSGTRQLSRASWVSHPGREQQTRSALRGEQTLRGPAAPGHSAVGWLGWRGPRSSLSSNARCGLHCHAPDPTAQSFVLHGPSPQSCLPCRARVLVGSAGVQVDRERSGGCRQQRGTNVPAQHAPNRCAQP